MASSQDVRLARRRALGEALRSARTRAGLTQEGLAHRAGLDRSFYAELETGRHSTTLDRLVDISDALGVSVRDLLAAPVFEPPRER